MICTNSFIFWDAHDLKGVHGLSKHVCVLLARYRHFSIGQETVLAVILQTQLG